jgi:hypothetical protein
MAKSRDEVASWLRERGVAEGVISDEAGYLSEKYADPDENIDAVLQQSLPSYMVRSTRPTQSAGGVGGDADRDGDGLRDTGYQPRDQYPRDQGAAETQRQFDELMGLYSGINNDVTLPEYDLASFDDLVVDVPGEDLGPAIDDTLLDLMEGEDPLNLGGRWSEMLDTVQEDDLGLGTYIKDLLERTAGGGVNSERLQMRREAARENLTSGSQAALADVSSRLADRGLISFEGAPQGFELDSTIRALEPLQRSYLSELRESEVEESERADAAEMAALERGQSFQGERQIVQLDALSRATGWSKDQIDQRLGAARTAQEREQMMADIALEQLSQNMSWNKFLAEFGLKREQVAEEIRAGRVAAIQPVLQMYLALLNQSRGGYI